MRHEVDRIQTEAIDAALQPEAACLQDGIDRRRMAQVQFRLARQEMVQIILSAPRFPGPGAAAEDGQPIVGRRAVGTRIGPDIPIGLVADLGGGALLEPVMLVRGMDPG
jgi:hypothetical protein